jgi:hypothetical protein
MKLQKPFIGIDLGGTIEDTWPEKRAWFASRGLDLGSCPLSRSEIVDRSSVNNAVYLEMVASVYSDDHILRHRLVAGCYEALMSISLHFRITVLSSRPESQRSVTLQWLRQNGLLPVVNNLVLIGSNENKLSWCRSHRVSILVDDDIRHLEAENRKTSLTKIHYTGWMSKPSCSGHQILKASAWANIAELVARLRGQTGS